MESPGTGAILIEAFFSSLFWVFMERAFAKSGWIPEKAKALFFLELVEATDDFETSSEVLMHGLHLKIEGYAKETVAMRGHIAGLHAT